MILLTLISIAFGFEPRAGFQFDAFEKMAIQDRGRTKPFQTFAEESLLLVSGKRSWKGQSATEVVLGWLFRFEEDWNKEPFVRVPGVLKEYLGLASKENFFSPQELRSNVKLPEIVKLAEERSQRKERVPELERSALELQNKLGLLQATVSGYVISILPNSNSESWYNLSQLVPGAEPTHLSDSDRQKLIDTFDRLGKAFRSKDATTWNQTSLELAEWLPKLSQNYPSRQILSVERTLNNVRPFRGAWIFYLFSSIFFVIAAIVKKKKAWTWAALFSLGIVLLLHTVGFILRMVVAGRPPVTNMYESVLWVSFGCIVFSIVIGAVYKARVIPAAAAFFSTFALVLADNLPNILDSGIHPLEPVLRSNFWLTIHVLTITLGYAAFALSLGLGNATLAWMGFRPKETPRIQELTLYMYRAMQIGVVLLAAGTILGGVWADYSWGRFWGWDPKEVWALIALLLYLAVLHGRFSGWLKGFGFAASTVISFMGVLMAWYGVNFVLGAGLHSYGFGTGGIAYVAGYVALQVGFVVAMYIQYRKFAKGNKSNPSLFPKGRG